MEHRYIPIYVLLAAMATLSSCNGKAVPTIDGATVESVANGSSKRQSTLVVTSAIQSSFGATANDINQDFADGLEEHFVDEGKKQFAIAMKNMGYPGETTRYEVGTVFFNEQGERLAVTTMKASNGGAVSKIAWWIIDGEIRRAVCVDMAGNAVPVRFGPCAAKIAEVFGYKHWALD